MAWVDDWVVALEKVDMVRVSVEMSDWEGGGVILIKRYEEVGV